MVRLKIRQDFERTKHIHDLGIINMLLHKNQQEYQETMNSWKQEVSRYVKGHVSFVPGFSPPSFPSSLGHLIDFTTSGLLDCGDEVGKFRMLCRKRFDVKMVLMSAATRTTLVQTV